jgi:hypothetical protein
MNNRRYFTDYPVAEFGDLPHQPAPYRPVTPLAYDGNKYVVCAVSDQTQTVRITIKSGYLSRTRSDNPKARVKHRHLARIEASFERFLQTQAGE